MNNNTPSPIIPDFTPIPAPILKRQLGLWFASLRPRTGIVASDHDLEAWRAVMGILDEEEKLDAMTAGERVFYLADRHENDQLDSLEEREELSKAKFDKFVGGLVRWFWYPIVLLYLSISRIVPDWVIVVLITFGCVYILMEFIHLLKKSR